MVDALLPSLAGLTLHGPECVPTEMKRAFEGDSGGTKQRQKTDRPMDWGPDARPDPDGGYAITVDDKNRTVFSWQGSRAKEWDSSKWTMTYYNALTGEVMAVVSFKRDGDGSWRRVREYDVRRNVTESYDPATGRLTQVRRPDLNQREVITYHKGNQFTEVINTKTLEKVTYNQAGQAVRRVEQVGPNEEHTTDYKYVNGAKRIDKVVRETAASIMTDHYNYDPSHQKDYIERTETYNKAKGTFYKTQYPTVSDWHDEDVTKPPEYAKAS